MNKHTLLTLAAIALTGMMASNMNALVGEVLDTAADVTSDVVGGAVDIATAPFGGPYYYDDYGPRGRPWRDRYYDDGYRRPWGHHHWRNW
jgi:hypothetical protein